ncbi:MAG: hypothetical protein AAGA68_19225 [Pseudomonadota bacterium]
MTAKFYMQFVLDEGMDRDPAQYCGVVEVENLFGPLGLEELESLLAENFDVDTHDVQVIHYARLH